MYTAEGRELHERVDEGKTSYKSGVRITRSEPLRNATLGIAGVADVIEWHKQPNGKELPFPVEYKRGKPKKHNADKIQLCAQALCLEEMLGIHIPSGALFYGETMHRLEVEFTPPLREQTRGAAEGIHELFERGLTPPPDYSAKCKQCSLLEVCQPNLLAQHNTARNYLASLVQTLSAEDA